MLRFVQMSLRLMKEQPAFPDNFLELDSFGLGFSHDSLAPGGWSLT